MDVIEAVKALYFEKAIKALTDVKKAYSACFENKAITLQTNWGSFKNCIFAITGCNILWAHCARYL